MLTERLTDPQITGLETWLEAVDPHEEVMAPQLVLDAIQALIEEVREWRAGALTIDKVAALAVWRYDGLDQNTAMGVIDGILVAHGAKP